MRYNTPKGTSKGGGNDVTRRLASRIRPHRTLEESLNARCHMLMQRRIGANRWVTP